MDLKRTELLIGSKGIEKLKNSHVIVFGLGGVGGFVVEALVRCGVGELSIVDYDTVDSSNVNRQIIATSKTIGRYKTDLIKERAKLINPEIKINSYNLRYEASVNEELFSVKYDYIVDAIDLVTNKLSLVKVASEKKIPIISSMGTGNKIDPTNFQISDINKTSVCPLARVMRRELKSRGIKKLKVLFSTEVPKKPKFTNSREKSSNVGSISFVPSVAGLIIAGEVIKDICGVSSN